MAKAKFDFQRLLLEKGEKIALGVAAAAMLALGAWGLSKAVFAESGDEMAAKLKTGAGTLNSSLSGQGGTKPPELDKTLTEPVKLPPLNLAELRTDRANFDLSVRLEQKRRNPVVLGPTDFQVDFMPANLKVYSIQEQGGRRTVLILRTKEKGTIDMNAVKALTARAMPQAPRPAGQPGPNAQQRPNVGPNTAGGPPRPSGSPAAPNTAGGPPSGRGGPPGMSGPPPGMGGPPPGYAGGYPGAVGGSESGSSGDIGSAARQQAEAELQILALDPPAGSEEAKTLPQRIAQAKFAEFIRPQRMAVIYAAFPYRAQAEEFRKALRMNTVGEVYADQASIPKFKGYKVQRRAVPTNDPNVNEPSKWTAEWSDVDVQSRYMDLFKIKVGDVSDQPELYASGVMLDPRYELTYPLPQLARGEYPKMNLKPIEDVIRAHQEAGKMAVVPSAFQEKFNGLGSPFVAQGVAGPGVAGAPPGMPGSEMGSQTLPPGMSPPFAPRTPFGPGNQLTNVQVQPPESVLIRFLDLDIQPGLVYQYRMQMRLINPNYGVKPEILDDKSAARTEFLYTQASVGPDGRLSEVKDGWVELPQTVRVPPASYLYVTGRTDDPTAFNKVDLVTLQMQSWFENVRPVGTSNSETVGDWVVTDIPTVRGEPVGRIMPVSLPIWKATQNGYTLGNSPPPKDYPVKKPPQPTVFINFLSKPKAWLVDFAGGKQEFTNSRNRNLKDTDESALEVLLLGSDNKLRVRSTAQDADDAGRKDREAAYKKWVEDTKKASEQAAPPSGAFPPGGKGGGSPSTGD